MKSNLLDLFYNFVVQEASHGRINCFFKYNMIFNTKIVEDHIDIVSENDNSDLLIPTLIIKDKYKFEHLLLEYVQKALNFYGDDDFYEEVRNSNFYEDEIGISKEKLIMTLLWSNATVEDFEHPCDYLSKRISFFELGNLSQYSERKVVGYSEFLDSNRQFLKIKVAI